MSYSFIKNDSTSFSSISRIYEVYNSDIPQSLRICFVIGFDRYSNKYFITLLGEQPLRNSYNLSYDSISTTEFIKILYEFFNMIEFMSPEDFTEEGSFTIENMPPLTKENFLLYATDIEPYYLEDIDEYDGIYSTSDHHTNFLLDEEIVEPKWLENFTIEEYGPYGFDEALDYHLDGDELAVYCEIDFELLEQEYHIAQTISIEE